MPETATTATPDRPQRRRAASPFIAPTGAPVRPAKAALNYLAVCVAVIAVVWASLAAAGISLNFDFVAQYRVRIWDGFCMTVGISAASLVLSLVLGVLVAAGQGARFLPLLPVRLLRENHPRHAAHRAGVLLLLHHRHGLGHRQPRARRHHHPVAVLRRLHRRNRARQPAVADANGAWPSASPASKPCATWWRPNWWPARCRRSPGRWSHFIVCDFVAAVSPLSS